MLPLGIALSGTEAVADFERIRAVVAAAEAGGFDFICLPERPGFDPIALSAGLAAVTQNIGLIPSCAAPFHQPYNLARRLGSIDHISRGRLGWCLDPMPSTDEAERCGNIVLPGPDVAADRAAELAAVVAGLWDSWDDDAFMRDKATGHYFDRTKFHWLDHQGDHYKVRGPLDTARPPQGRPPLMATGTGAASAAFAVAAAEVVQGLPQHLIEARRIRATMTRGLAEHGRAPDSLRVLAGIAPASAAVASGPLRLSETPRMLAALMAEWWGSGAVDGFVIHLPDAPEMVDRFTTELLPALRDRGLRDGTSRGQLREKLALNPALSRYVSRVA